MQTEHHFQRAQAAQILLVGVGKGASYPAPTPAPEPPPPPPVPAGPAAPDKTVAEQEIEKDLANKAAQSAAKRTGRNSTILTAGMTGQPNTMTKGLLSYESMTGQIKDKLGA